MTDYRAGMPEGDEYIRRIDSFIAQWRETGGSELANTQSFINGLCHLDASKNPRL